MQNYILPSNFHDLLWNNVLDFMLMWFMLMSDLAFIITMNKFKFKLFTRLCTVISMGSDRCIQLEGTVYFNIKVFKCVDRIFILVYSC